ncbi:peptidoglycan-binding domain-containing protein [Streptomyces sp. NPDC001070]
MRQGATGERVKTVQYLLNAHGASLTVDGDFGPGTDSAVRSFQSAHGLTVDGIVGPGTWQALILTVRQGSTGPAVSAVQSQLKAHGASLTVDGDFGPGTDSAVRSFQSAHGLAVDGIVGSNTWQALVA